jgi:hypothetical protein
LPPLARRFACGASGDTRKRKQMTDSRNGWNNCLTLEFCWGSSKYFVIRHFGFCFPNDLVRRRETFEFC